MSNGANHVEKPTVLDVEDVHEAPKGPSGPVYLPKIFALFLFCRLFVILILFLNISVMEPASPTDTPRFSGLSPLAIIATILGSLFTFIVPSASVNRSLASCAGAPGSWPRKVIAGVQIFSIVVDVHLAKVYAEATLLSATYVILFVAAKWAFELAALNAGMASRLAERVRRRGRIALPVTAEPAGDSAAARQDVEKDAAGTGLTPIEVLDTLRAPPKVLYLPRIFASLLTFRLLMIAGFFKLIADMEPADPSSQGLFSDLGPLTAIAVLLGAFAIIAFPSISTNRALHYSAGPPGSWLRRVLAAVQIVSMVADVYLAKVYGEATLLPTNLAVIFILNKWALELGALEVGKAPGLAEKLRKRLGHGRVELVEEEAKDVVA